MPELQNENQKLEDKVQGNYEFCSGMSRNNDVSKIKPLKTANSVSILFSDLQNQLIDVEDKTIHTSETFYFIH